MSDRDLTLREAMEILSDLMPEEARAEVEAFLGEGWTCRSFCPVGTKIPHLVTACRGPLSITGNGASFRAAVAALKAAWRDAVRPIMTAACYQYETHREEHSPEEVVSRVLKEDS